MSNQELIIQRFQDSVATKMSIIADEKITECIACAAQAMTEAIRYGGKLVICGNGGSASDALHFAGEIVGRFQRERNAWPAVVLNADVATMTAIANDYGFDEVFARQAEGHVTDKDVFVGISTSGNSMNVLKAVEVAKKKGAKTVGLLGKNGGNIGQVVDYPIIVRSDVTTRIQESHICIIHILCEIIENNLQSEERAN